MVSFTLFGFMAQEFEWWVDVCSVDINNFHGALLAVSFHHCELYSFDIFYLKQFFWPRKDNE